MAHDRFAEQDREYFQVRQPLDYHTAVPGYNFKETERPQVLANPTTISALNLQALSSNDTTDLSTALDTDDAVGGQRFGFGIVDIGAQRVKRNAAFAIPFDARDLRAAQTAYAPGGAGFMAAAASFNAAIAEQEQGGANNERTKIMTTNSGGLSDEL